MTYKNFYLGLFITTLALLPATQAGAASPFESRRTLFVPFGQQMVVFEAPLGMCFLNPSASAKENAMLRTIKLEAEMAGGQMVAAFADCMQIASGGTGSLDRALPIRGAIRWLNSVAGEKSRLSRADYLDSREPALKEQMQNFVNARYDGGEVDVQPHRTEAGIAIAYGSDYAMDYEKLKMAGVTGSTLIRQFPVEVNIIYSGDKDDGLMDRAGLYSLIDDFVSQQVALNE